MLKPRPSYRKKDDTRVFFRRSKDGRIEVVTDKKERSASQYRPSDPLFTSFDNKYEQYLASQVRPFMYYRFRFFSVVCGIHFLRSFFSKDLNIERGDYYCIYSNVYLKNLKLVVEKPAVKYYALTGELSEALNNYCFAVLEILRSFGDFDELQLPLSTAKV